MSSRSLTIIPCKPSSPLDIHRSDPTKPNTSIPLRAQPDPTNPIDIRPIFSRCLARATRTPPRPPDSPRSRPRPLVSSNGNPTSHAELGPSGPGGGSEGRNPDGGRGEVGRRLHGHKIYDGFAILCCSAHRIAQDRTQNVVLSQNVPSDLELPATGLGTAQLPHPQRWCLASNVHTDN